jgi:hypothetical protein
MGCFIAGCAGALLGRLGVFLLWIFGWFRGAEIGFIWLLVGFLFTPLTLICVGIVNIYFGGEWGLLQIIALILCLISDIGSGKGATSRNKRR